MRHQHHAAHPSSSGIDRRRIHLPCLSCMLCMSLICDGLLVFVPAWGRSAGFFSFLREEATGDVNRLKDAVAEMAARVEDPDLTPSARLLFELRDAGASFFEFALDVARSHKEYFASIAPLPAERALELEQEARLSLERQHAIEAADDIDFEEYLARYFEAD